MVGIVVVAPLVGARIEIMHKRRNLLCTRSLPSWERGLKLGEPEAVPVPMPVAPLVGARIEILKRIYTMKKLSRRSPRGSAD